MGYPIWNTKPQLLMQYSTQVLDRPKQAGKSRTISYCIYHHEMLCLFWKQSDDLRTLHSIKIWYWRSWSLSHSLWDYDSTYSYRPMNNRNSSPTRNGNTLPAVCTKVTVLDESRAFHESPCACKPEHLCIGDCHVTGQICGARFQLTQSARLHEKKRARAGGDGSAKCKTKKRLWSTKTHFSLNPWSKRVSYKLVAHRNRCAPPHRKYVWAGFAIENVSFGPK